MCIRDRAKGEVSIEPEDVGAVIGMGVAQHDSVERSRIDVTCELHERAGSRIDPKRHPLRFEQVAGCRVRAGRRSAGRPEDGKRRHANTVSATIHSTPMNVPAVSGAQDLSAKTRHDQTTVTIHAAPRRTTTHHGATSIDARMKNNAVASRAAPMTPKSRR